MIERKGYTTVNGIRVRTTELKQAPKVKKTEDKKPTANHVVDEPRKDEDDNAKDN